MSDGGPDPLEELIEALSREVISRVVDDLQIPFLMPATVQGYRVEDTIAGAAADVTLDTDGDPGKTHSMSVLLAQALSEGDRVMVFRDPPQGGYVIGAPGPGCPSGVGLFPVNDLPDSDTDPTIPTFYPSPAEDDDASDQHFFLECGGFVIGQAPGQSPNTSVVIPEDGVYQIGGTMGVETSGSPNAPIDWSIRTDNDRLEHMHSGRICHSGSWDFQGVAIGDGGGHVFMPCGPTIVHLEAGDNVWAEIDTNSNSNYELGNEAPSFLAIERLCCELTPIDVDPGYA